MIPARVRLRAWPRASTMRSSCSARRRRREAARRRALADPGDEAPDRAPSKLVDIGRLAELVVRPRCRRRTSRSARSRGTRPSPRRSAPAGALPDRLAHGRADRRSAGASPRHDRRLARPRRPGVGSAGGDAGARRRARRARAGRRAGDPRGGLLHRRLRDGARAGGGADRDPRSEARRVDRLGVPEVRTGVRRTGRRSASRRSSTATTARSPARRSRSRTWAATPIRAKAGEDALAGGATAADAPRTWPKAPSRRATTAGSAEYRAHLARVLGRRALEEALTRAA